jgi:hypothetical protein
MALAITVNDDSPSKKLFGRGTPQAQLTEVLATFQFDDDYQNPAGYAFDVTDLDALATEIVHFEPAWSQDATSVNRLQLDQSDADPDNWVWRVFVGSTNAEVADEADLSGLSGKFLVRAIVKTPNG